MAKPTPPSAPPKPRLVDRIVGPSPREEFLDRELHAVEQTLSNISMRMENRDIVLAEGETYSVHEALTNIDMMLDAQGWTNIFEYDDDGGLSIRQVKDASRQLRELLVGNPFVGNGYRVRAGHTWAGGVSFSSRLRTGKREVKPLPDNIRRLTETPWATRYLFGNKPYGELERATFCEGNILLLGRDSDKRVQRLNFHQITGMLRDPNNDEEVWAYRREWRPRRIDGAPSEEKRVRWYYTDIFPVAERRGRISGPDGRPEVAELGYTILDFAFNRQTGWALGVPDALCIIAWARLYREFLVNGYIMSRSLAKLAYKITVASTQAGENAAVTVAAVGQAGSTHIEGAGNTLTPLASAGKGYDFASGNGLAGGMAAGLGVSLLALLSNPAAATGSNAAAQSLDPVARATAAIRRGEWEDDFARLFRYFGMERQLVVGWGDLPSDTIQRIMQAWTLVDGMETFGPEVLQAGVAKVMGIIDPGAVPSGWKPKSQRKAVVKPEAGGSGSTDGSGQGTDDGSGGSKDDHDDDE